MYHTLEESDRAELSQKLNRRFSVMAQEREVSFGRQFWLLYKRFMIYTWRNPVSIVFLIFMGCFTAFLQSSIFWKLGEDKYIYHIPPRQSDNKHNTEIVTNLVGLAFLVSQDQFVNSVFGQIL